MVHGSVVAGNKVGVAQGNWRRKYSGCGLRELQEEIQWVWLKRTGRGNKVGVAKGRIKLGGAFGGVDGRNSGLSFRGCGWRKQWVEL